MCDKRASKKTKRTSSPICLCIQDYESLRASVMIRATLVNTQTHIHRQMACDRLYYKLSQLSKKTVVTAESALNGPLNAILTARHLLT